MLLLKYGIKSIATNFLFLTGITIIVLVALPNTEFNLADGIIIMGLITISNNNTNNLSNKKDSIIDMKGNNNEKDK